MALKKVSASEKQKYADMRKSYDKMSAGKKPEKEEMHRMSGGMMMSDTEMRAMMGKKGKMKVK